MQRPLTSATWDRLAAANDENVVGMTQLVGRSWHRAQLFVDDDATQVLTDIPNPMANQVAGATFAPETADRRISELRERAWSRGLPLSWAVGPRSTPADLGRRLVAQGFELAVTRPIMAAEIFPLKPQPLAVSLRITEVTDGADLLAWAMASQACFSFPEEMLPDLTERYVGIGLGSKSPVRHFVGWVDGKPVACATIALVGGVAGLYTIGTAPDFRRLGIGAAITMAACEAAMAVGYRYAILQSSRDGERLYAKLGFRYVGEDTVYMTDGPPAPPADHRKAAEAAMAAVGIHRHLAPFDPTLAGTIPLRIDTPSSDLDIICEAYDLAAFESTLRTAFGDYQDFRVRRTEKNAVPTVIANFRAHGFDFEIFGQPRPTTEQNAVRHMLVGARLLALGGEPARQAIQALKAGGMKTEPAFAHYFGIPGDPYQALLALADASDDELRHVIAHKDIS